MIIILKKVIVVVAIITSILFTGCASVRMASKEADLALKNFAQPPSDKAGLYIYRNSWVGQALKKDIFLDSVLIGETANKVYFYKLISPGQHTLSTESEQKAETLISQELTSQLINIEDMPGNKIEALGDKETPQQEQPFSQDIEPSLPTPKPLTMPAAVTLSQEDKLSFFPPQQTLEVYP